MDLAWRYPVIVQVISRNNRDLFFGSCPDFGIETFEVVGPDNQTQEYMFHLKLRRLIRESLSVHKVEQKEFPVVRSASLLTYSSSDADDLGNCGSSEMVPTSTAAKILGVHAETIRRLFDSGSLTGTLTKGGQRLISVKAIHEEKEKMAWRAKMRRLELRAKKTNAKRKEKRVAKERLQKAGRIREMLVSNGETETLKEYKS